MEHSEGIEIASAELRLLEDPASDSCKHDRHNHADSGGNASDGCWILHLPESPNQTRGQQDIENEASKADEAEEILQTGRILARRLAVMLVVCQMLISTR